MVQRIIHLFSPHWVSVVAQWYRIHLPVDSNPWVRNVLGERNGNPLQYSCLGNPMDRGAWQATVHEIEKGQTCLRNLTTNSLINPLILPFHLY